ncbi:MAG: efflux RND transporter permease subunit [Pseudomonadales bacterium]
MFSRIAGNPRLMILLVALLLVTGLGAVKSLPRMEDPVIAGRYATVITAFPGATAERVEALVSRPLEDKLRELPEIRHITSNSRAGLSAVTIELQGAVTDPEPVMARARDKINDLIPFLPRGVSTPQFDDERGWAFTLTTALVWQGEGEPDTLLLARYAEELGSRLRNAQGTEYVDTFGAPAEEILVEIDFSKVQAMGLDTQAIAARIGQADAKVAAGQYFHRDYQWQLELAGELTTEERIRRIPISSDGRGNVTSLGDLASIRRAPLLPLKELAIVGGQQAVVVGARIRPDVRMDEWIIEAEALTKGFQRQLPDSIGLSVIFNQQPYTNVRLQELVTNVVMGFAVIILVLLFTLGWKAALVVASALPLTAAFTLFCMQVLNIPIHQISVTGLVVALGIMVDNAIVITDAVARYRREGMAYLAAVNRAIQHLWVPLAGSTLTTILAFLPIVLMPGPAGEFIGSIALTVIFSLIGSYLISHSLIAGMAGRFLETEPSGPVKWYRHGIEWPTLSRRFEGGIRWSLRHPWKSLLAVALVSVMGFSAGGGMEEQFFPPADRDMFHIEVFMPSTTSTAAVRELTERITDRLDREEGIESIHWFIGNSAPSFYYNLMQNKDGMPHYAQAMIKAVDFRQANRLLEKLQPELDRSFTEAQILVRKLDQGPPYNAPIEFRILGDNIETLKNLGQELREIMSRAPHVIHMRSSVTEGSPKLVVNLNETTTAQVGLTLTDAAGQLQRALVGEAQGSVLEATQEMRVRVRAADEDRSDLARIRSGYLVSYSGELPARIPLNALGDFSVEPARSNISRRNGSRVNTIEAYVRIGILPDAVLTQIQSEIDQWQENLPAGYSLDQGGEAASRDDTVGYLLLYVGVIAILLVVVVAVSFNSFRLTGLIFLVAAQSAGMGMLSISLSGYPFGFIIIVALMGLMGLAINAAIVILAELRASPQACQGNEDAIVVGVMNCSRHILSTTLTTVGGFFPLIIDSSTFWPPFAITIAGGTALTTLLSLFFVPAAFRLMAKRRAFEPSGTSDIEPNMTPLPFS